MLSLSVLTTILTLPGRPDLFPYESLLQAYTSWYRWRAVIEQMTGRCTILSDLVCMIRTNMFHLRDRRGKFSLTTIFPLLAIKCEFGTNHHFCSKSFVGRQNCWKNLRVVSKAMCSQFTVEKVLTIFGLYRNLTTFLKVNPFLGYFKREANFNYNFYIKELLIDFLMTQDFNKYLNIFFFFVKFYLNQPQHYSILF